MNARSGSRLVYSTDTGRICPVCGQPQADCRCKGGQPARAVPPPDSPVRVSREKAGRGGKQVTVVRGLPLDDAALAALGKRLRSACGAGGTAKEGRLELQGDHADKAVAWLQAEGFAAKRSGG
jgi:translation initiation factor 1